MSRKLEGESLGQFSRRFLPEADKLFQTRREAISGVLSEFTRSDNPTPSAMSAAEPKSDTKTFPPMADEPKARFPVALVLVGVVLGLAAVMIVAVIGLAATGHLSPGDRAQASVPTPPPPITAVVAPPPVAPVVAPPPTPAVDSPPVGTDPSPGTADVKPAVTQGKKPVVAPTTHPAVVIDPNAPRVRRALVVMPDASQLDVTCGDVSSQGTASADIRQFPAGTCTVKATYLGHALTTQVLVQNAATVQCSSDGTTLTCTP